MKEDKGIKNFLECLSDFLGDPEGLTDDELLTELKEQGIDVKQLEKRVKEIVREQSKERRLAWLRNTREKRAHLEKILDSKQIAGAFDIKGKIKEILKGSYGKEAFSFAEAYFRKKETLSEKDLQTLLEDMEHLNLLEELENKKDR
jgi:post-segregation antitoxin (ccd killing protein)